MLPCGNLQLLKLANQNKSRGNNPCTNKLSNGRLPCHHLHLQNRNPNFPQTLADIMTLHGSRYRFRPPRGTCNLHHLVNLHTSEPRRPPLHHTATAPFTNLAPSWAAPPFSHRTCNAGSHSSLSIIFSAAVAESFNHHAFSSLQQPIRSQLVNQSRPPLRNATTISITVPTSNKFAPPVHCSKSPSSLHLTVTIFAPQTSTQQPLHSLIVWREKVHFAPRVTLLLDSQTSQLVNNGQLVKVSSQLWWKLQKLLNKRGRIRNWTEIKLLIN